MHRIETSIEIDAPASRVWSVLLDFAAYGRWNPFIRSLEGDPAVGERLEVEIRPPGARAMRFRPRVLANEPERELRWKGRLLVPGLLDGEHAFTLEPALAGGTIVHHDETFTGLLVPFLRGSFAATRKGFEAMNAALKVEAERPAYGNSATV